MKFHLVECNCKVDEEYVDGSKPSFYTDERKAAYMFNRLKVKCKIGQVRLQRELQVIGDELIRCLPPLPLKEYNLYFGVHLNGLHIMKVE